MKNNRNIDIRSLKGPRRRLKLEVIEGKRYIKKRDLKKYFFDDMWSIKDIHQSIINLLSLTYDLRIIIKKLKKYYREYPYYYPTNLIEYQFFKVMKRMKLNVIPQFFIEKLHIHVDFLIDDYIILELDGQLHNYQKDKVRDLNLNSLDYKVVRIDLKKENLNRFPKIKDIRLCLKKYLLKV